MTTWEEISKSKEYYALTPEDKEFARREWFSKKIPDLKEWEKVSNSKEYKSLTPEDKELTRNKFFNERVQPKLLKKNPFYDLGTAKKDFDSFTLPGSGEYQKDRFLRGIGNVGNMGGYSWIMPSGEKTQDFGRLIGYEGLQAPNKAERYLGGVTEFAGGSVATAPFLALGGAGLGPKTAAGIESMSTILGGLGSELGGDIGGEFGLKNEGQFAGSLLGIGSGATIGGISHLVGKGKSAFKDRKGIFSRMADKQISGLLTKNQKYIDNIIEADTLSKRLDLAREGGSFDLAQASDAPGINSLFEIYSSATPEIVEDVAYKRAALSRGLNRAQDEAFPAGGKNVRQVIDDDLLKTVEERGVLAAQYRRKDPQKIGEDLKRIRDVKANQVKADISADYHSVYRMADQENIKVDMSDVGDVVLDIFGDDANIFQNPEMPSALSRIYNKYTKKKPVQEAALDQNTMLSGVSLDAYLKSQAAGQAENMASFEELHSLWKLVNKQASVYSQRGDDNGVRALMMVKEALEGKISAIENSGSAVALKFKEANTRWAKEYAEIYKKGTGGKLARFNKYGDVTPDEDVVRSLFFRPDKTSALDDFVKIYGDDPDAINLLRNGALDIFSKDVTDKTTFLIDPQKVDGFLKKYELLIDKVPGLRGELTDVSKRNAALAERADFYQGLIDIADKEKLSKTFQNDDIGQLMEFLTREKSAPHLVRLAKDAIKAGAGQEFARSLARQISTMSNGYEYLMKNKDIIKPIMEKIRPGHFNNLEAIIKGWEIANRAPFKKALQIEKAQDPLKKATGTTMDSMFAQWRAAQHGRSSGAQMAAAISAKFVTKFGFDSLMDATQKALFDPDLAATLARLTKEGPAAKVNVQMENTLRKHLLTAGVRTTSQLFEPRSKMWYEKRGKESQENDFLKYGP